MRKFSDSYVTKEELEDAVTRFTSALDLAKVQNRKRARPESYPTNSKFGIPDLEAFRKEVSIYPTDSLISCAFMDLDNFKAVNDKHNHLVGDAVIQEAIRIAELVVKEKRKVFHRSGDEVLVLLPNFDSAEACAVAERIQRVIEEHDFQ